MKFDNTDIDCVYIKNKYFTIFDIIYGYKYKINLNKIDREFAKLKDINEI